PSLATADPRTRRLASFPTRRSSDLGARQVGAVPFATYTPQLYFGKGAGDLPESLNWARPFAVTGIFGYSITSSKKTRSPVVDPRSEEHTSELQSRGHLVCRLLLEKK